MRAKVIRNFQDKYTNALHEKDTFIEAAKERIDEINSTSLGIFVEAVEVDLSEMTKKEIVEYAKDNGIELDIKMTKAEMIKELV